MLFFLFKRISCRITITLRRIAMRRYEYVLMVFLPLKNKKKKTLKSWSG